MLRAIVGVQFSVRSSVSSYVNNLTVKSLSAQLLIQFSTYLTVTKHTCILFNGS